MSNDSPQDSTVLDRIAKCLALHKNADGGEAAAALAAAQRLMEVHGISEEAVKYADVKEARAQATVKVKPAIWESFLTEVVADAFRCKSLFLSTGFFKAEWTFIGGKTESQIAAYVFSTLLTRLKRARRAHLASMRRIQRRITERGDIFCVAWVATVRNKVGEFAGTKEDEERLDAYIEQKYSPATLESKNRLQGDLRPEDAKSYFAGVVAGQDVELHHGVTGEAPRDKLLASAGD